ncbi:hypothetical protein OS493_017431, partial [Desmophyllum pertusum]
MYSAVAPPEQTTSGIVNDDGKEKEGPPRGISEETWEKFQQLRERRIKSCKVSTEKRMKDIKKRVTKSVLDNLKSDEEVAVLRDQGVIQRGGKKCKPNMNLHQLRKNKATEGYEKRWNELQQYFNSDTHPKEPGTSSDLTGPTPKDEIEKGLEVALSEKRFEVAEKLNKQLIQHDFAVKVAQAVECRDYAKRKAAEEEK